MHDGRHLFGWTLYVVHYPSMTNACSPMWRLNDTHDPNALTIFYSSSPSASSDPDTSTTPALGAGPPGPVAAALCCSRNALFSAALLSLSSFGGRTG